MGGRSDGGARGAREQGAAVTREFLGWREAFLPALARWLEKRHLRGDTLDLSGVVVALPGRRAGRRLRELLAAGPYVLIPPVLTTTGGLPEHLYTPPTDDTPRPRIADDAVSRLGWMAALKALDADRLRLINAAPPETDDYRGWFALAGQVANLHETLAADGVRFADVRKREEARESGDPERWTVLERLEALYHKTLQESGFRDRQAERLAMLDAKALSPVSTVVVAGIPDLNELTCRLLAKAAEEVPVTVVVQAPPEEAGVFDEFGRPLPAIWATRTLPVRDEMLVVADQPRDQALAVIQLLRGDADLPPEEITIGACDEELVPTIVRSLEFAGLSARSAAGTPLSETRPFRLFLLLERYLSAHRFRDFATLLRHPDVNAFVTRRAKLRGDLLSIVDVHAAAHLPAFVSDDWLGSSGAIMKRIARALEPLEKIAREGDCTLPEWARRLGKILTSVYGARPEETMEPALVESLIAAAGGLQEMAGLPETGPVAFTLSFPDAVAWLLARLEAGALPDPGGDRAIEVLGRLELALDDAPRLIVTGFNEHAIPGGSPVDAFLPDGLKRALGMTDASRRYARDAHLVAVLGSCARRVTFLAGRRGGEGDPLLPSRLLLACDDGALVARIRKHFHDQRTSVTPWRILPPGNDDAVRIPVPDLSLPIPDHLSASSMATFLSCPYTFYLEKVLGLKAVGDDADELDPMAFGSATHDVLKSFGRDETLRHETDARVLATWLAAALKDYFEERFGTKRSAALRLQEHMIAERLGSFASWQAEQASEGWTIVAVEEAHRLLFTTEEGEMPIEGVIDRIDRLEKNGLVVYRVLDYKTSAEAAKPNSLHRRKSGRWFGLQLPLYEMMVREREDYGRDAKRGTAPAIVLGYYSLCQKPQECGFYAAKWTEGDLKSARSVAIEVVREVIAKKFWPPMPPERKAEEFDPFAALRMDSRIGRDRMIEELTRKHGLPASALDRTS